MVASAPTRAAQANGRTEQTRARYPDQTGYVERDGVQVFWERYGEGEPAILLMPTWSIMHSRHWKLVIPVQARSGTVVTFDGRGSGRSDRPSDPAAYADTEFVADAVAVLDATGTSRAVVAGLSMGTGYAFRLAIEHPDRVRGLILFGESIVFEDPPDGSDGGPDAAFAEPPASMEGWDLYNAQVWREDWSRFAEWFARQMFSEPHSTKQLDDTVGWMHEADPETLVAMEYGSYLRPPADWEPGPPTEGRTRRFLQQVHCPILLVHGTDDHITSIGHARRLATAMGLPLVEIEGGGHVPIGREPVLANRLIRDFVRGVGPTS